MSPEPLFILDLPLGDGGLTVRHAVVAVVLIAMTVGTVSTLWNGRRGRLSCGAPRRREGRCRRPLRAAQLGCGIHGNGWVARDAALGLIGAVALSLMFWNFEAVVAWVGNTISEAVAA